MTAFPILCAYQYYNVSRLYHLTNKKESQNGEGDTWMKSIHPTGLCKYLNRQSKKMKIHP